jgi:hypothetical protein
MSSVGTPKPCTADVTIAIRNLEKERPDLLEVSKDDEATGTQISEAERRLLTLRMEVKERQSECIGLFLEMVATSVRLTLRFGASTPIPHSQMRREGLEPSTDGLCRAGRCLWSRIWPRERVTSGEFG